MKPKAAAAAQTSALTSRTESAARNGNGRRRAAGLRKVIPIAIGAVVLFALYSALRPKPVPVEVAKVSTGPLTVTVLEEGKTRIRHRYTISPPVAGFLNRVELRAGAKIEAGKTVLATLQPQPAGFLDPRTRSEAEARLKMTEASRLQRETQVERARASLDLAKKEMARAKELKASGAIATKEWDAAESQVSVLGREFNASEFALRVADFEVAQATAALTQAQSPTPDSAEPLKIVSPVNGYILNVQEESARIIGAGMPIMEVGDPNDMEAEIELLSSDAASVQPGADVSIEQWGGDRPLRGRVTLVEPGGFTKISALGVEEQRVRVRVDFLDPIPADKVLGDRYRVEARIVTWHADTVLQVPTGALFRRGGDWMTFLYEDGKARQSKVEILHNNGVGAEVKTGLTEGQTVIVHAPDAVSDGAHVKPRE